MKDKISALEVFDFIIYTYMYNMLVELGWIIQQTVFSL